MSLRHHKMRAARDHLDLLDLDELLDLRAAMVARTEQLRMQNTPGRRRSPWHVGVEALTAADARCRRATRRGLQKTADYTAYRRDGDPHLTTIYRTFGGGFAGALHAAGLTGPRPEARLLDDIIPPAE